MATPTPEAMFKTLHREDKIRALSANVWMAHCGHEKSYNHQRDSYDVYPPLSALDAAYTCTKPETVTVEPLTVTIDWRNVKHEVVLRLTDADGLPDDVKASILLKIQRELDKLLCSALGVTRG